MSQIHFLHSCFDFHVSRCGFFFFDGAVRVNSTVLNIAQTNCAFLNLCFCYVTLCCCMCCHVPRLFCQCPVMFNVFLFFNHVHDIYMLFSSVCFHARIVKILLSARQTMYLVSFEYTFEMLHDGLIVLQNG